MRMLYCPIHGSFVGHEALSSIRCPIIVSEACCLLYVWPPASKAEAEYILILADKSILLDLKNIISRQYFFPVMVLPYEFCVSHETMNLQEVSLSDYQKEKPDNGGQNGTNYRRS